MQGEENKDCLSGVTDGIFLGCWGSLIGCVYSILLTMLTDFVGWEPVLHLQ